MDVPPRPSNPQPLQSIPSLDITLLLSPITPLENLLSPSLPSPPPPQPSIMGHPLYYNYHDYHGPTYICNFIVNGGGWEKVEKIASHAYQVDMHGKNVKTLFYYMKLNDEKKENEALRPREIARAVTSKEDMASQEILHGKTKCVKFNGAVIIPSKLTNRNEVFDYIRSDKYNIKVQWAMGDG
ncbi:hypothetical protein Tco_0779831 [Tanacetum coccineum]